MHYYQPRGGERLLFAGTAKHLVRASRKERTMDEKKEPDGVIVNIMAVAFEVAIIYGFWMTVSWIFGVR